MLNLKAVVVQMRTERIMAGKVILVRPPGLAYKLLRIKVFPFSSRCRFWVVTQNTSSEAVQGTRYRLIYVKCIEGITYKHTHMW